MIFYEEIWSCELTEVDMNIQSVCQQNYHHHHQQQHHMIMIIIMIIIAIVIIIIIIINSIIILILLYDSLKLMWTCYITQTQTHTMFS